MADPANTTKTSTILSSRMICVLQYMFFITNFVFLIGATLLITIGSVIEKIPEEYRIFTNWDYEPIGVMKFLGISLIALSIIANITSINPKFLFFTVHGGLTLTLLIVELNFGIRAYVTYDTSSSVITGNMLNNLETYYDLTKSNWDYMQHYLECCGIHNISDWASYNIDGPETTVDGYTFTIPPSCCVDFKCIEAHTTGCLNILNDYFSKIAFIIFCITTILGIVKVLLLSLELKVIIKTTDVYNKEETREPRQIQGTLLDALGTEDLNVPTSSNG